MPLIVKGSTNIVSKHEANNKAVNTKEESKAKGLEKLSDSQKEVRQEIPKRPREDSFPQVCVVIGIVMSAYY